MEIHDTDIKKDYLDVTKEVEWGQKFTNKRKHDENSKPLKPAPYKSHYKPPYQLVKRPASLKNTKQKQPFSNKRLPGSKYVNRAALTRKQYIQLLAVPRKPVYDTHGYKIVKRLQNPISPRIAKMALPNRRLVVFNFIHFQNILPPWNREHLINLLAEDDKSMTPAQAHDYFQDLRRKQRIKRRKLRRKTQQKTNDKKDPTKRDLKYASKLALLCAVVLSSHLCGNRLTHLPTYGKQISTEILKKLKCFHYIRSAKLTPTKISKRALCKASDNAAAFVLSVLRRVDEIQELKEQEQLELESATTTETEEKPEETPIEEPKEIPEQEEEETETKEAEEEEAASEITMDIISTEAIEEEELEFELLEEFSTLFEMSEDTSDTSDEEINEESTGETEHVDEESTGEEGVEEEEELKKEEESEEVPEEEEQLEDEKIHGDEEEEEEMAKEETLPEEEQPTEEEAQSLKEEEQIAREETAAEEEPQIAKDEAAEEEEEEQIVETDEKGLKVTHQIELFPHAPDMVCCASLKSWAIFIGEVAENAKRWCIWIQKVMKNLRHISDIVKGEFFDTDSSKPMKFSYEKWQTFVKKLDEDVERWQNYNTHIQTLTDAIINKFHGKRVECCHLCSKENIDFIHLSSEHLCEQLIEGLKTMQYWRELLSTMVDEADVIKSYIEDTDKISIVELPDDASIQTIEEVQPPSEYSILELPSPN